MSIQAVAHFASALPWNIGNDVLGYARSVADAFPDIAVEAGVAPDPELRDQVVFVAGVRKLHALLASGFWTLENSLALLQRGGGPTSLRLGSLRLSRGSSEYRALKDLLDALERYLAANGLLEIVRLRTLSEIVVAIRDERH